MASVFRRAEIPAGWAGREQCPADGNPGLALRISAALFELTRFQKLPIARVARVVDAFSAATDRLASGLGIRKVASVASGEPIEPAEHPIEMRTLVTLDLSQPNGADASPLDFAFATRVHRELADAGVRLGQPVRCVRLPDGGWGATLRIGISMPQVCRLDALDDQAMTDWLDEAMGRIAAELSPRIARRQGGDPQRFS
jgi:hypothetical protein